MTPFLQRLAEAAGGGVVIAIGCSVGALLVIGCYEKARGRLQGREEDETSGLGPLGQHPEATEIIVKWTFGISFIISTAIHFVL